MGRDFERFIAYHRERQVEKAFFISLRPTSSDTSLTVILSAVDLTHLYRIFRLLARSRSAASVVSMARKRIVWCIVWRQAMKQDCSSRAE